MKPAAGRLLALGLLAAGILLASEDQAAKRGWRRSVLVLLAAQTADVASSYGAGEANPILRSSNGTFGRRGLTVKVGTVVGILLLQALVPKAQASRAVRLTNYGVSVWLGANSVRNAMVRLSDQASSSHGSMDLAVRGSPHKPSSGAR